jgi:NAD+ kinase
MPTHRFSPIVLLGRIEHERVRDAMSALAAHLHRRGITVLADPAAAAALGAHVGAISDADLPRRARLVVAIGGDGTLLRATRLIAGHDIPLLGVNRGRLGFLTDVGAADMLERVDEVLAGSYVAEPRMMLRAELVRPGCEPPLVGTALNDVVVQKFEIGRMIEFETWVDGVYLNTHRADGLIVATPTGSTAYALSCGGPILAPELDAIALVPVCPHTLSDRPLVIRAGRQVELRLLERVDTKAQVTLDGVLLGEFLPGDRLTVSSATPHVTLLHPPGHDFYHVLRSKLHWGSERGLPARDD